MPIWKPRIELLEEKIEDASEEWRWKTSNWQPDRRVSMRAFEGERRTPVETPDMEELLKARGIETERGTAGERFIGEWLMPGAALSWTPLAMTGWRALAPWMAAGGAKKAAAIGGRVALSPLAGIEKATEATVRLAASPIRALVGKLKPPAIPPPKVTPVTPEITKPEYLYHGSPVKDLDVIKASGGDWGRGIYFTTSEKGAVEYSKGRANIRRFVLGDTDVEPTIGTVYRIDAKPKKPLIINTKGEYNKYLDEGERLFGENTERNMAKWARKEGYDGIINNLNQEGIIFDVESVPIMKVAIPKAEAGAEKATEASIRLAASPIRALAEKYIQIPERTLTHSYEQLVEGHKLARAKNLINRKTGNPTATYKRLAELYTGRTSMKDMTRAEADTYISVLKSLEVEGRRPPKIPKITIPQLKEFWDNIPVLKEVGWIDYHFRQKFKVLRMVKMNNLVDDMQRAEVELLEEKGVFLGELRNVGKLIGNDAVKGQRVFDALENPLQSHLLDPDEQQVFLYARKFFDDWANTLKLPVEKRKINYITHIFDAQIRADVKGEKTLPLEILKAMEYQYPKRTFMPFLKERFGAEVGLKKDPFAAMEVYEAYALRQKYFTPLLQRISSYISMFEAKGKLTIANYLKDINRRIAGRPSKDDILINQSIGDFAKNLKKLPGLSGETGKRLEALSNRGNLGAIVAHNWNSLYYMSWLGLRPASAIRNLGQHTLGAAVAGVDNMGRGIGLRFTREGKEALAESLVMRGRKLFEPVAGLEESRLQKVPMKLQNIMLSLFKGADKQNVADSFLAGYAQAKQLGLPRAWAIRLGDEVAENSQYLYTKMARSLFEESTAGRFLTPFTSWPRNFMELLMQFVQGRQSIVLQQYMKETGKQIAIPKKDWKPLITYMALLTGAYVTEGVTAFKAAEYTGWTSINTLGRLIGGDIPGLTIPRALAFLVAGTATGDTQMIKKAWNEIRPDRFIGIIRQLEDIAEGKADILSLFFYMERAKDEARERQRRGRGRTPSRRR